MKKIILGIIITSLFISCTGDYEPGSEVTIGTTIDVLTDFQFCSSFHEDDLKNFRATIMVDKYDSNGVLLSNFRAYQFDVTNDYEASNNTYFQEIEVPESGTYAVTVTYQTFGECFKCCSSTWSCDYIDSNGNIWSGGKPMFRGTVFKSNMTSVPSVISIVPNLTCF